MTADPLAVSNEEIARAVRVGLTEDLPQGDATTTALFPAPISGTAVIRAKQALTVAGVAVARETFRQVDPALHVSVDQEDGQTVKSGTPILTIRGDARSILSAERVALNFLQHLSGIATLTAQFCHAVRGYPVRILDTRKTAPGLRALQKWAVRVGGGMNHRFSLSDAIMIKDNHLMLAKGLGLTIVECCRAARARRPAQSRVIVEVDTLEQVPLAVEGGADVILLDNMTPSMVRQAVSLINGRAQIEVSGGITLSNVAEFAAAGPTFISVGALTHSAPAVDLSLDLATGTSSGASNG